jgi:uncharacterized protein
MNLSEAAGWMRSLATNIVEFTEVLRLAGVRVSVAETMDAVNALEHVDLLHKEQVCFALSACLAKSEEERRIFAEAFDAFFVPVFQKQEWIRAKNAERQQKRAEVGKQAEELKFQEENLDLPDYQKEVYAGLSQEEKRSIRGFLEKTSSGKNVRQNFKPIVERLVSSKLEKIKQERLDERNEFAGVMGCTPAEAGMIAEKVVDAVRKETQLLHKKLGEISDEDVPAVIHLIRKLTGNIRRDNGRRNKNTGKKARLDLKKTIHSNLHTGGVLFKLEYKRHPKRKDHFLILCDVSASMYRFSGFVLQFLLYMQAGTSLSESCIFAEQLERINCQDGMRPESFEKRIKGSSVWGKGTNINRALECLLDDREGILKSSAIVVLISDAKTLDVEKAVHSLSRVYGRVKRIIWLNPTPRKEWERIPGIDGFSGYCTMLDCSTLERLEIACRNFFSKMAPINKNILPSSHGMPL